MSLEIWSTAASIGTFVVISATAIAALVQLRHMRNSNQIAVFAHLEAQQDAPEVIEAQRFASHDLAERMEDPVFRQALTATPLGELARAILPVMNTFEGMGTLVKHGFIDRDLVLDLYGGAALGYWNTLAAVIPIVRRYQGDSIGINFEYLAALAQQAQDRKAFDTYPRGVPRMPVDTRWLDADSKV